MNWQLHYKVVPKLWCAYH